MPPYSAAGGAANHGLWATPKSWAYSFAWAGLMQQRNGLRGVSRKALRGVAIDDKLVAGVSPRPMVEGSG
jgi:hypothetical protein